MSDKIIVPLSAYGDVTIGSGIGPSVHYDPAPLDLKNMVVHGWAYDGVLHLAEGVSLDEIEAPNAHGISITYGAKIVDHEGNVLREAQPFPEGFDE